MLLKITMRLDEYGNDLDSVLCHEVICKNGNKHIIWQAGQFGKLAEPFNCWDTCLKEKEEK